MCIAAVRSVSAASAASPEAWASIYIDRALDYDQLDLEIGEDDLDGLAQGGAAVFTLEPGYLGKQIFHRDCAGCHVGNERKGPEIIEGYNSRAWIADLLRNPSGHRFFGVTAIDDMKPVTETGQDFAALVELVYAETGDSNVDAALVSKGRALFDDGSCSDCHSIDWETEELKFHDLDNAAAQEPLFVPKSPDSPEGDGYILTVVDRFAPAGGNR